MAGVVGRDRPSVVQLVSSRDPKGALILLLQLSEVALLALAPRILLRPLGPKRVAAGRNEPTHAITEEGPDLIESRLPTVVLGSVVQNGRNGFFLRPAVVQDE